MQKIVIALALIAALVGLASASKGLRGSGFEEEELLGGGIGGLGGGRYRGHGGIGGIGHRGRGGFGGGFGGLEDEYLLEELQRRPHLHGGIRGRSAGGLHGLGGGLRRGGRLARRGGLGLGGVGGGLGGVGGGLRRGGLGLGGIGGAGFRDSEGEIGALNAGSSDFESGVAESGQAGLLAGRKDFEAGQHFGAINDQEGLHKHQVINSDKTIIKDRTTGVNDVDSFRNTQGVSEGSHIGGSESGVAAGIAGGRIAGERDRDSHLSAVGAERTEAAGLVGGAF